MSAPDHPATSQQGCGDMTIPAAAILRITDIAITEDAESNSNN